MPRKPSALRQAPTEPGVLPTFKLYYTAGDSHICGRTSPALYFLPHEHDEQDPRPHAYVHRSLGDHLIEDEGRYEWSPEALAAFKESAL